MAAAKPKLSGFLTAAKLLTPEARLRLGRELFWTAAAAMQKTVSGCARHQHWGMAGADLSGTDLRWTDLSDVNRANLSRCDLIKFPALSCLMPSWLVLTSRILYSPVDRLPP